MDHAMWRKLLQELVVKCIGHLPVLTIALKVREVNKAWRDYAGTIHVVAQPQKESEIKLRILDVRHEPLHSPIPQHGIKPPVCAAIRSPQCMQGGASIRMIDMMFKLVIYQAHHGHFYKKDRRRREIEIFARA